MFVYQKTDPPLSSPDTDKPGDGSSRDLNPVEHFDFRTLIPLAEIHRYLPRRPDGRKLHRTTTGRWASKGCRGVVLHSWLIGGMRFTDARSIAEFVARLTASRRVKRPSSSLSPPANAKIAITTSTRTRRSASRRDRIEEDLKRFGL